MVALHVSPDAPWLKIAKRAKGALVWLGRLAHQEPEMTLTKKDAVHLLGSPIL